MCHEFSGLGISKTNPEHIAFAYYLIRKTLSFYYIYALAYSILYAGGAIPKSINYIHDMFENDNHGFPWLDFRSQDILPVLRPINSNNICANEYRGCRMFALKCTTFTD